MSKWVTQKLGDISDSCLGKMLDKEKNKGEYHPYLANLNVRWGSFDLHNLQSMRFEDSEQKRYGLEYGDLIICEGGEPGRCAIWRDEVPNMKIQKALHRLRVRSGYSNEFVYYRMLLAGRNGELKNHFIGSTIKHLTGVGLKRIEFKFPSFDEQNKIAKALSVLDAKIDLNNRINAELEAMAKTLYDYWFVQFDFPDENGKPYKSSGGKMEYNPTLKRHIPAGWATGQLGDWVSFKRGISYKSNDIQDTGIPFLNLNSFSLNGDFKFDGTKYFNGKFKESARLAAGELIMAITDVTRNADIIGKSFVVPDIFAEAPLMSCDVAQVITKKHSYIYYLQMLFNSQPYHDHVKYYASGTLVLHLDLNGVNWFYDAMPPDNILSKFAKLRKSILDRQHIQLKENQQLIQLRDWLLPMLMNGQVKIRDSEQAQN